MNAAGQEMAEIYADSDQMDPVTADELLRAHVSCVIRRRCGDYFNDPSRFDSVILVEEQADLNNAAARFQAGIGQITAWGRLAGPPAISISPNLVATIVARVTDRVRLPEALMAPLESSVRLLLAARGTADPRNIIEIYHQRVDDFDDEFFPLFEEKIRGCRMLYVIHVRQYPSRST